MRDDEGVGGTIMEENHAQVSMTQPVNTRPFTGHRLDAGHGGGIQGGLLQLDFLHCALMRGSIHSK